MNLGCQLWCRVRSVDGVPGGGLRVGAGRGCLLPGPGQPRDERQQQQPQVRQTGRAPHAVQVRASNEGYPKVPEDFTIPEKAGREALRHYVLCL